MTRVKPGQRKRARAPKVRSGCVTCKIRKIKCDEGRPFCVRCTSTGRRCDGYDQGSPPTQSPLVVRTESPFGAAPEARLLQFFVEKTMGQFQTFFPDAFWNSHVLQFAFAQESIRHGLVSLAAHHERFTRGGMKMSEVSTDLPTFAVQQHSLAIQGLLRCGDPAATTAVHAASCVIFICIEALQGNHGSAIRLFRHGLRMLQQLRQRQPVDSDGSNSPDDNDSDESRCLAAIEAFFRRFAVQVALLVGDVDLELSMQRLGVMVRQRGWPPGGMVRQGGPPLASPSFASLYDARQAFLELAVFVMSGSEATGPTCAEACAAVDQWTRAFRALEVAQGDALPRRGATLLELHRLYLEASLKVPREAAARKAEAAAEAAATAATTDGSREAETTETRAATSSWPTPYDPWTPFDGVFETLVSHAEQALQDDSDDPQFHMDLGVLPVLFSAVIKCRNPVLRRRAIAVMQAHRLQEGIWPSGLTARVAERVLVLEGGDDGKWAGPIESVAIYMAPDARLATLRYGLPERVHEEVISW